MLPVTLAMNVHAEKFTFVSEDNLTFVYDTDTKTASFRGSNTDSPLSGSITVPATINVSGVEYAVTSVGENTGENSGIVCFRMGDQITSITISEGIKEICNFAFNECTSLTSVDIPVGLTRIGIYAFSGCTSLTSVFFPGYDLVEIGKCAFYGCTALEEASFGLHPRLTSIGDFAFADTKLKTVSIPPYVTTLGHGVYQRTDIKELLIHSKVTSIGIALCGGCSNLEKIFVDWTNPKYDSRAECNAIVEKETNTLITTCKTTKIYKTVTKIGYGAYYGSTFNSFEVPEQITAIDDFAFQYCMDLTSLKIPANVTSLGRGIIDHCGKLESIYVYYQEPIIITEDVFQTLNSEFDFDTYEWINNYTFTDAKLYVPKGTKAKYEAADGWKNFKEIIEMDEETGIDNIMNTEQSAIDYYNLNGHKTATPSKGINIIKMPDGSVRKVVLK